MNKMRFNICNDSGAVTIIVATLILVIITLVGMSAMNTTTVELTIAGNDQRTRMAFYNADSGAYGIPKIVSRIVDISGPVVIGNSADSNCIADGASWDASTNQNNFYRQVMGYDNYDAQPDVIMGQGGFNTQVDVERIRSRVVAGGGAEYASGHEGIGSGYSGGVAVYYGLDSLGRATLGSANSVAADYRKVVGVPGGL
jgi:hypothetical protein